MRDYQYGWTCRIFPLLPMGSGRGVLWDDAETAYKTYVEKWGGVGQTLERLAERGGFGVEEFVYFFNGLGYRDAEPFKWSVKTCHQCHGSGDVVNSEEGGLIMKCGVCCGAGSVLPDEAKIVVEQRKKASAQKEGRVP